MRAGSSLRTVVSPGQSIFYPVICDEEQRCSGRRAYDRRANAIVYPAKPAGGPEAGGRLEAGFEGVEGEEGGIDCGACYAACLGLSDGVLIIEGVVGIR